MGIEQVTKYLSQVVTYVTPGPKAKEIISKYRFQRSAALSYLGPLIMGEDKICGWCNEIVLTGRQQKYCSHNCLNSAHFNFYPQHPATKIFILFHLQQCACAGCGVTFEDFFEDKAKRIDERLRLDNEKWRHRLNLPEYKGLGYWHLGDNTGHIIQVDHKEAIFRGGDGIGLENIQVLCLQCHKDKTKKERSCHR